jgi:hypothetical protein
MFIICDKRNLPSYFGSCVLLNPIRLSDNANFAERMTYNPHITQNNCVFNTQHTSLTSLTSHFFSQFAAFLMIKHLLTFCKHLDTLPFFFDARTLSCKPTTVTTTAAQEPSEHTWHQVYAQHPDNIDTCIRHRTSR